MTTQDTGFPVYVRVGPYNVNPEDAIDKASVISHEYGHSLGLPDYYTTGTRETYGDWNLMATDNSQNMDVIGKQELGWLVPRVLEPGRPSSGRLAGHEDQHAPDRLAAAGRHAVHAHGRRRQQRRGLRGEAAGRQIIDPALVPSGDHVWWSRSGNDFGCTPTGGHNLDISCRSCATFRRHAGHADLQVLLGHRVGLRLRLRDASTDNGRNYTSLPSANGYTTPAAQNPNANACQTHTATGSPAPAARTRPARRPSTA